MKSSSLAFGILMGFVYFTGVGISHAETPVTSAPPVAEVKPSKKAWYDTFTLRGYAQVRYNRLLETNTSLKCEQCDKSWGDKGGLFVRRARLILSGNVHDRVYVYIQPDLAQAVGADQHFLQLRDLYFDLALDSQKEFRFRVGQSKVPYGWENLQSSSNRLPLDRTDAINSAAPNERDLGVFFYWAPTEIRDRFKLLTENNLKGTGDYGVVGLGFYNGQSANKAEVNNNLHVAARVTYPWKFGDQYVETSIQAYTGLVTASGAAAAVRETQYADRRVAASLTVYPQPLGLQAEWSMGEGPEYNPVPNLVGTSRLDGGYVMTMYQLQSWVGQSLIPFARAHFYSGGKKHETDARSYRVREYEVGVEWQPISAFELTAMYTISSRRFEDSGAKSNLQEGNLLRLQAQFNY